MALTRKAKLEQFDSLQREHDTPKPRRIRAPFKIAYDSPSTFRVWGFGLGYLPMQILGWGYNVRGTAGTLRGLCSWFWDKGGNLQIRNLGGVDS